MPPSLHGIQPVAQVGAFDLVVAQVDGQQVGGSGELEVTGPLCEFRANGWESVVVAQGVVDSCEEGEACRRAVRFGDGDRSVETHDRGAGERFERGVVLTDRGPVRRLWRERPCVLGCDQRLESELFCVSLAWLKSADESESDPYLVVLPPLAVLVGEGHQPTVVHAGVAT